MTLAQGILDCDNQKEVIELVGSQARAALMNFKRNLIGEILRDLVTGYHGDKWLKTREGKPTPWVRPVCGPRASNRVKCNGHYRRCLIAKEGVIEIGVPQLECLICSKSVLLNVIFLLKRRRCCMELDHKTPDFIFQRLVTDGKSRAG